jgi:hypothetical protein
VPKISIYEYSEPSSLKDEVRPAEDLFVIPAEAKANHLEGDG